MSRSVARQSSTAARTPARKRLISEGRQVDVSVSPANGRPWLSWVGKHALRHVPAFPAQHIETFAPSQSEIRNPTSGRTGPKNTPKVASSFTETTRK